MCTIATDFAMILALMVVISVILATNMLPIHDHIVSMTPVNTDLLRNYYMLCVVILLYAFQVALAAMIAVRKSIPTVNITFAQVGQARRTAQPVGDPESIDMSYMPLRDTEVGISGVYAVEFN
jgi:hypothetical protein